MKYLVVPTVWPVAGRMFRRGDTVTGEVLGPNAASYVRLGLVTKVVAAKTKTGLLTEATELGIDVPKAATKTDIAALIAKEHHGV